MKLVLNSVILSLSKDQLPVTCDSTLSGLEALSFTQGRRCYANPGLYDGNPCRLAGTEDIRLVPAFNNFMHSMTKILTVILLLAGVAALRADDVALDTNALATLAVQDHGRKKPFTTFAHEMLLTLSGKASLPIKNADGVETKLSAEKVILDLWFTPDGWDQKPVIMLNFLELKRKLDLPEDQKLFSYSELVSKQALLDLLDEAQKQRQAGAEDKLTALQKEAEHLGERLKLFQDLESGEKETVVPNTASSEGKWLTVQAYDHGLIDGSISSQGRTTNDPSHSPFMDWMAAYRAGDIAKFNSLTPNAVDSLRVVAPQYYPSASSLQFEHNYMTLEPFLWAWVIYLVALIVLLMTGLWMKKIGYQLTWALVLVALGFEIWGFLCRIIISGRPPVTDLYETVIWVSFIGMVFAIILEATYRKRFFFYAGLPDDIGCVDQPAHGGSAEQHVADHPRADHRIELCGVCTHGSTGAYRVGDESMGKEVCHRAG
jgi:hypothetical protein